MQPLRGTPTPGVLLEQINAPDISRERIDRLMPVSSMILKMDAPVSAAEVANRRVGRAR